MCILTLRTRMSCKSTIMNVLTCKSPVEYLLCFKTSESKGAKAVCPTLKLLMREFPYRLPLFCLFNFFCFLWIIKFIFAQIAHLIAVTLNPDLYDFTQFWLPLTERSFTNPGEQRHLLGPEHTPFEHGGSHLGTQWNLLTMSITKPALQEQTFGLIKGERVFKWKERLEKFLSNLPSTHSIQAWLIAWGDTLRAAWVQRPAISNALTNIWCHTNSIRTSPGRRTIG